MQPKPRILFLCVHNSARSQLAEGLARARLGDKYDIFSAGSEPTSLHPLAARVLTEYGIDPSTHRSKSVNEFANQAFDTVVTLCKEEVCPVFLNAAQRLHWGLPDPAGVQGSPEEQLAAFRGAASELENRLAQFESRIADDKALTR